MAKAATTTSPKLPNPKRPSMKNAKGKGKGKAKFKQHNKGQKKEHQLHKRKNVTTKEPDDPLAAKSDTTPGAAAAISSKLKRERKERVFQLNKELAKLAKYRSNDDCQKKLQEVLQKFQAENLDFSSHTLSTVINCYVRLGKLAEALRVFHDQESRRNDHGGTSAGATTSTGSTAFFEKNLVAATALLKGVFVEGGDVENAKRLVQKFVMCRSCNSSAIKAEMNKEETARDSFDAEAHSRFITTFFRGCLRWGEVELAMSFYTQLRTTAPAAGDTIASLQTAGATSSSCASEHEQSKTKGVLSRSVLLPEAGLVYLVKLCAQALRLKTAKEILEENGMDLFGDSIKTMDSFSVLPDVEKVEQLPEDAQKQSTERTSTSSRAKDGEQENKSSSKEKANLFKQCLLSKVSMLTAIARARLLMRQKAKFSKTRKQAGKILKKFFSTTAAAKREEKNKKQKTTKDSFATFQVHSAKDLQQELKQLEALSTGFLNAAAEETVVEENQADSKYGYLEDCYNRFSFTGLAPIDGNKGKLGKTSEHEPLASKMNADHSSSSSSTARDRRTDLGYRAAAQGPLEQGTRLHPAAAPSTDHGKKTSASSAKLIVEVGAGNGDWILQKARDYQELQNKGATTSSPAKPLPQPTRFIASELRFERCARIWSDAVLQKLDNVEVIGGDAKVALSRNENHLMSRTWSGTTMNNESKAGQLVAAVKPDSVDLLISNFPEPPQWNFKMSERGSSSSVPAVETSAALSSSEVEKNKAAVDLQDHAAEEQQAELQHENHLLTKDFLNNVVHKLLKKNQCGVFLVFSDNLNYLHWIANFALDKKLWAEAGDKDKETGYNGAEEGTAEDSSSAEDINSGAAKKKSMKIKVHEGRPSECVTTKKTYFDRLWAQGKKNSRGYVRVVAVK
ncbi:unnamed protein product [Amoebophrya sp. A120]|nr:unnamed protein product [Amoebophrya sp. A120]|eukprot:GSA120T00009128001.1